MSDDLDSPESHDHLYEERGQVPISLPLMQGDVFRRVDVPGLGEAPRDVQVIMHPCSMRAGSELRERITIAPVVPYQRVNDQVWRGHIRVMPLPELDGNGSTDMAARFLDLTSVQSSCLNLSQRIAALSTRGVLLLQQRLVYFHTRLKVDLETLQEQVAPVLTELELQADWVEAALDAAGLHYDHDEAARHAITEFTAWLDEDERRQRLQQSDQRADVRRAARKEARRRYTDS